MTTDGLTNYVTSGMALKDWLNSLTLRLYQNVYAPTVGSTTADFDESTFPGYVAQAFSAWTGPVIDPNNNLLLTHTEVDFSSSGPSGENVCGAFVTENVHNKTMFAEANGAPFPMASAGLVYGVVPLFYAGQIQPPL